MSKSFIILCLFLLGFSNISNAQYGRTYREVGLMAGPVFFQSDFGARNTFENYYKNNGISIGAFYYVSAIENSQSLRENFKLRLEVSYMTSQLKHYGEWVDPSNTNKFATQLRAMSGKVETINLGFQVEYYPFKTDDYNRGTTWSPYISGGAQISNYTSKVESSLGPLGSTITTPTKYLNAYRNDSNIVASLTTSVGTRYMLDDYHALVFDARIQYYFSDWVDGLNPDRNVYTENQANDWSTTFNIGYVYYFN
ncbi:MAG: glutamate dehydrogenase [Flavobacterium sp.]|nr:glutamate dehydrogenase [Flavobacterium sp.]